MRRLLTLVVAALAAGTALSVQPPQPGPPPGFPPGARVKGGPAKADPPKKEDPAPAPARPATPEGPPEFEAKFVDDSVLKVTAIDSTVTLATKYGKLTVPLADVVRVEVGFRFPEGVEAKVEEAVANLGAPSYRDREDAEKALLKFAEYAVPSLRRASKSTDAEVARRAVAILGKLTDKLPHEKLALKDFDLVETTEGTIRGRIETVSVKVKNRVIGETGLRLTDLRSLRSTAVSANEFTVDASQYARQNDPSWYDTGLDLTPDQPVEITASGTIDLAPNQGGAYTSGPGGNPVNGNSRAIFIPNGRAYSFTPGALVGRIGHDGMPFVLGASYKSAKPSGTGRLYLKIAPSAYGTESSGSYKVKVKVGG